MGTKKTTAKAAPAKGKEKTEPLVLRVGMIWTDPKSGKKYNVVETSDGSCKSCGLYAVYGADCPMDIPSRPLLCDAKASDTDRGVSLVEMGSKPAKSKNPVEKAPYDDSRRYVLVSIDNIEPSPYQSRKDGDVSDLAASIRTYGVLNPVTVRENPEAGYELIAGHRRWMAAQQAGLTQIPAIVIECDDQTAAEMCVTENMQRKDLSPLEEAEGVNALIGTGHKLDDIANRLGRTRQWVARRASLLSLDDKIKARLAKPGDVLAQAPVEVLEIVARMPQAAQYELVGMFGGANCPTVGSVRQRAEALMCSLKNPAFSVKACQACTKRTGATPDLFEEIDGKLGNCLDADCYAEKVLTVKQLLVEDLRRDKADIVIVTKDWMTQNKCPGVQSVYSHTECPKDSPDAIPAVEIKEDGNVRKFFVHKPVEREEAGKVELEAVPYETQVQKKVVTFVRDWLGEWNDKLEGKCADEDAALKTPFNELADKSSERHILRLVAAFGISSVCSEDTLDDDPGYKEAPIGSMLRKLFQNFASEVHDNLGWWKIEYSYPAAITVAEACGMGLEKHLVDLAKHTLKDEGVKEPAEKPAKKGKAK